MRLNRVRYSLILFVSVVMVFITSCAKNEEEARKFPSSQPLPQLAPGPLTSITLANGITAYFQEEHSQDQVAVEVLYRAGVIHEGEDKALISLFTTLMLYYSESASVEANEAVETIRKVGRMNAETVGGFTHYDYIVPPGQLDLALQVEAERMAPRTFTDELLKTNANKSAEDLDYILNNRFGSLVKYGLIAFNQAFNYKKTFVPVYNGAHNLNAGDVVNFRDTFYRRADMVIVIIGDFDTEEAKALVKKRFEHLPAKPAPSIRRNPVKGNHQATWDIDAEVIFFAFPGPYNGAKERVMLTMFGSFLNYHFLNDPGVTQSLKKVYASDRVYPVRDLPFFIYVRPKTETSIEEVRATVLLTVQTIIGTFSESLFDAMKSSTISFVESSMLEAQFDVRGIPHHQLIGQEALNVGIKHLLKDNLKSDEFVALVESISLDEAKQILESRLIKENMREITIKPRER